MTENVDKKSKSLLKTVRERVVETSTIVTREVLLFCIMVSFALIISGILLKILMLYINMLF